MDSVAPLQRKKSTMNSTILLITTKTGDVIPSGGYIVGALLAILILGYLVYSLIKPENF